MNEKNIEIKKCPFCGNKAEFAPTNEIGKDYRVECSYCQIGIEGYDMDYLVNTWNDRINSTTTN